MILSKDEGKAFFYKSQHMEGGAKMAEEQDGETTFSPTNLSKNI